MDHVDLYCERTDSAIWAEPLNALTNLAFLLVALLLARDARTQNQLGLGVGLLIIWLVAFGLGSFLFHTFANTITRWLDVLPIALFIVTYLCLYAYSVANQNVAVTAALAGTFMVAAYFSRQFPHFLNGSLIYAPTVVLLVAVSGFHWLNGKRDLVLLMAAIGVFTLALVFRTIDTIVCPWWPVGTHFLWHLCTALTLLLATKALIVNLPRRNMIPGR
jgi:hypothetical protein